MSQNIVSDEELLSAKNIAKLAKQLHISKEILFERRRELTGTPKQNRTWPVPHYNEPLPEKGKGIFDMDKFSALAGYYEINRYNSKK